MLAVQLMAGQRLSPYRQQLVKLACRVLVHASNLSNSLYWSTELREDGEPRVALTKLLDLSKEARELLARAFGDDTFTDAADPLSALMRSDGR